MVPGILDLKGEGKPWIFMTVFGGSKMGKNMKMQDEHGQISIPGALDPRKMISYKFPNKSGFFSSKNRMFKGIIGKFRSSGGRGFPVHCGNSMDSTYKRLGPTFAKHTGTCITKKVGCWSLEASTRANESTWAWHNSSGVLAKQQPEN